MGLTEGDSHSNPHFLMAFDHLMPQSISAPPMMEILHNNPAWKTELAIPYREYLLIASANVSYNF